MVSESTHSTHIRICNVWMLRRGPSSPFWRPRLFMTRFQSRALSGNGRISALRPQGAVPSKRTRRQLLLLRVQPSLNEFGRVCEAGQSREVRSSIFDSERTASNDRD